MFYSENAVRAIISNQEPEPRVTGTYKPIYEATGFRFKTVQEVDAKIAATKATKGLTPEEIERLVAELEAFKVQLQAKCDKEKCCKEEREAGYLSYMEKLENSKLR